MNTLISAIVTTHNRKELVTRAIDSILAQTYNNIECIVIDDASTDGTEEVLDEYIKAGLINYYRIPENETNGGNHARNIGIRRAKGDYIAFLDDDDEWMPRKIELQVNALSVYPMAQFVHTGGYKEYDNESGRREYIGDNTSPIELQDLSKEVLLGVKTLNIALMVSKALLLEVGCYDEKLRYLQEYELSIRLFQKTKAVYLSEPLFIAHVNLNDKKRLTNNVDGWEETVKIISEKHENLFNVLTQEEKSVRKYNLLLDGIYRARNCRAYGKLFKYYFIRTIHPDLFWIYIKYMYGRVRNKIKKLLENNL